MTHNSLLRFILPLFFCFCLVFSTQAAKADWYLYTWSSEAGGTELGQFETTDDANIFVLPACNVTVQGIKFCVHNNAWTSGYGWGDGGNVSTAGADVVLGASTTANGWLALPVGAYKVTFNASTLTIRFDEVDESQVVNYADWYLYTWSENGGGQDLGQFQVTDDANVFVIPECEITTEGFSFSVRNSSWTQYGWKSESVTATGVDVELASSNSASGWIALPIGTYKVTFNLSALTIRFDVPQTTTENNDWYLYLYDESTSTGDDLAQFAATADENVFVIASCNITTQGIKFCVHNNEFESAYGWSADDEGQVSATGTAVALGETTDASGYLNLPVGKYKVTFDKSALTIRFDLVNASGEVVEYSEWYLYFYSTDYSLDGDAAQFITTSDANVFVIESCEIPGQGIKFDVHNEGWATSYGYGSANVEATGVDVELGTGKGDGWSALPAGTYKVTFNATAHTIRFDEVSSSGEVIEYADWYLYVYVSSTDCSVDKDVAQFTTTSDANVFVIEAVEIPCIDTENNGFKFDVHNDGWATTYGYGSANVTATGDAVELGTGNGDGWAALPAGTYKVTFNATAHTIRFDAVSSSGDDDYADHSSSRQFLRGGDLTMVNYVEDFGAVFRYKDGTAGDVFDILKEYGVNFARLRVYNAPGTSVVDGTTTYRTPIMTTANPSGYQYAGVADMLDLAKRAKDHGMQICVSLHLSDYWSHATMQKIPAAWANAGSLKVLSDSVYNFVYDVMQKLVAQGTTPEYISIGNESNYGILYQTPAGSTVSYGGYTGSSFDNAVTLFNRAYEAVKAVSPTTKVVLHHSYGHDGRISQCRSWFTSLVNNGCNFDVVGASYYPQWASEQGSSDNTPTGMLAWASAMETAVGKPLMVMETGYSWTEFRPSGRNGGDYQGQLKLNGSYNEATEEGQRDFMCALHDAIASDENILGYMYWDPIFVDQQVNGTWIKTCWAERQDGSNWWEDGNIISNTTWFDYTGKPLKALYQEVNSRQKKSDIGTSVPTIKTNGSSEPAATKVIRDGQLLIIRDGETYDVTGRRLM